MEIYIFNTNHIFGGYILCVKMCIERQVIQVL